MTEALGPQVFDGKNRYLRVWFSTDNLSFQQLSPDRRIAAVPYALQAANADTLDGQHAGDLALPSGALVMGRSDSDTTLIDAGFSYSGLWVGDEWRTREWMPTGRMRLAVVTVDGVIYAIGGSSSGNLHQTVVEAYDPVANAWTTKKAMTTGRAGLAAVEVGGIVYVMGGLSSATDFSKHPLMPVQSCPRTSAPASISPDASPNRPHVLNRRSGC
jgi:hypothetical protein